MQLLAGEAYDPVAGSFNGALEVQVTKAAKSSVLPSLNVPLAKNGNDEPFAMVPFAGETSCE